MTTISQRVHTLHQATEGRLGADEGAVFEALSGLSADGRTSLAAEYKRTYGHDLVEVFNQELSGKDRDRALSLLKDGTADWSTPGARYRLKGMANAMEGLASAVVQNPELTGDLMKIGIMVGEKSPAALAAVSLGFLGVGAYKVVSNEWKAYRATTEEQRALKLMESGEGIADVLMSLPGTGHDIKTVKGAVSAARATEGTVLVKLAKGLTFQPVVQAKPAATAAKQQDDLAKALLDFYQTEFNGAIAKTDDPAKAMQNLSDLLGPSAKALWDLPPETQARLATLLTDPSFHQLSKGDKLAKMAIALGPGFVKISQIAADTGGLPPDVAASLRTLQDSLPSMTDAEAAARLEAAGMGRYKLDKVIGVASIGEVRFATDTQTGEQVVVKLRRPGVTKEAVEGEFRLMRGILEPYLKSMPEDKAALVRHSVNDFEKGILEELDLTNEAAHIRQFNTTFASDPRFKGIGLKDVSQDGSILVMTPAQGRSIKQISDPAERAKVGSNYAQSLSKQAFETGMFHADPHPGNFRVNADGTIEFLDLGAMGHVTTEERFALQKTAFLVMAQDGPRLAKHMLKEAGSVSSSLPQAELEAKLGQQIQAFMQSPAYQPNDLLGNIERIQKMAIDLGINQKAGSFWLMKTLYTGKNVYETLNPGGEGMVEIMPSVARGLYQTFRQDPKLMKATLYEMALVTGTHPKELAEAVSSMVIRDPRLVDIPYSMVVALRALNFNE